MFWCLHGSYFGLRVNARRFEQSSGDSKWVSEGLLLRCKRWVSVRLNMSENISLAPTLEKKITTVSMPAERTLARPFASRVCEGALGTTRVSSSFFSMPCDYLSRRWKMGVGQEIFCHLVSLIVVREVTLRRGVFLWCTYLLIAMLFVRCPPSVWSVILFFFKPSVWRIRWPRAVSTNYAMEEKWTFMWISCSRVFVIEYWQ